MDTTIEKMLAELVNKVSEHFNLESHEALAAVAQSKLANDLSSVGNEKNLSFDELCRQLYDEIAKGE